jgi:hypothetical protein
MPAFSGQLTAIVQSAANHGTIKVTAVSEGLTAGSLVFRVK